MANDALKVAVGRPNPNGAIFRGVLGTALPTDSATALNAAFKDHGYVSSDGVTRAISKAFAEHNAWGGDMVKKTQGNTGVAVNFALIESANGLVLKATYGEDNVEVTPATASTGTKIDVAYGAEELPVESYVIELKDGNAIRRLVFPRAQNTTEDFTQTYSDEALIEYPVQLTLYKDAAGKYFYEYSDDGVFSA